MCDYSLEMYASRPAREGERYVTTRFPSGSVGLSAPGDCTTAVCVQYDTHLRLENISSDLQTRLSVKAVEDVVFARLEHGAYRDGIRFANGKEVSLQMLGSGVGASLTPVAKPIPVASVRRDILEHID
jgi:hypothetical protein